MKMVRNAYMRMDIRFTTIDAPNGGSVLLDVIRAVKTALDKGRGGPILSISSYAFKNPPYPMGMEETERKLIELVGKF